MQTRVYRIRIKEGKMDKVREWAETLKQRAGEVYETLKDEGVFIEFCFLESLENNHYLIYGVKCESIDKMREVSKNSTHPIDIYHKSIKEECFDRTGSTILEELFWFDR